MKKPANDRPPLIGLVDDKPMAILFQQSLADPLNFQQLIHRSEWTIAFTIGNDCFGFGDANTEEVAAQGFGVGSVEVDLGGLIYLVHLYSDRRLRLGSTGRCCCAGDGEACEKGKYKGRDVSDLHR